MRVHAQEKKTAIFEGNAQCPEPSLLLIDITR
jgi:hypothetical protein